MDIYMVGVRETTDPESWSVLFMECYDADDEQEIALGMDTYCVVVDPGQATYYGGVRECDITGRQLWLMWDEKAAITLGIPTETRFDLDLTTEQVDLLRRGLSRVLRTGRAVAVPHRLPE